MSNEFYTLQSIITASNELIDSSEVSPELKESAAILNNSVQKSLQVLELAAKKLSDLMPKAIEELQIAQGTWESKPEVVSVSSDVLLEQIGLLTGFLYQAKQIEQSELISQLVGKSRQTIQELSNEIDSTWFKDTKTAKTKAVSPFEQGKFMQDVKNKFEPQVGNWTSLLDENARKLHELIQSIDLDTFKICISVLDERSRGKYLSRFVNQIDISINKTDPDSQSYHLDNTDTSAITIDSIAMKIVSNFMRPDFAFYAEFYPNLSNLEEQFVQYLSKLNSKGAPMGMGIFPIKPEHFSEFKGEIESLLVRYITSVLKDRISFAIKLFEYMIDFYDRFLELQQRYREESPEQRQAEFDWITDRYKELKKVEGSINFMISSNLNEDVERDETSPQDDSSYFNETLPDKASEIEGST
jgi:hypothetical protein